MILFVIILLVLWAFICFAFGVLLAKLVIWFTNRDD